jgi:hypothetical protein
MPALVETRAPALKSSLESGHCLHSRGQLLANATIAAYVRYGSGADIARHQANVRFAPESGQMLVAGEQAKSQGRHDYCGSMLSSFPKARHCSCSVRMTCAVLSGVPPPSVDKPSVRSRSSTSGPLR